MLRIDKRLHQGQRMLPTLLPVGAQPRQHPLHKAADQIRVVALRQDEQPHVVRHQREPGAPLLVAPADVAIAAAHMQRRRRPQRETQPLAVEGDHVAQLLADRRG